MTSAFLCITVKKKISRLSVLHNLFQIVSLTAILYSNSKYVHLHNRYREESSNSEQLQTMMNNQETKIIIQTLGTAHVWSAGFASGINVKK